MKYNVVAAQMSRGKLEKSVSYALASLAKSLAVLHTYEFKWNHKKNPALSKTYSNTYLNHQYKVVSPEILWDF